MLVGISPELICLGVSHEPGKTNIRFGLRIANLKHLLHPFGLVSFEKHTVEKVGIWSSK